MKNIIILSLILFITSVSQMCAQQRRSNPIVSHMFTADPSAHVWEDGRLYIYPSTDVAPSKGYKTMDGYHVFSTDDMITWTDHGQILHSSQVEWGRKEGGFMWAPDCAYKDGTYYFYFPHRTGNGRETWKIGVATSTSPTSGFEVQGYIKGIKPLIDPCVYIDDDGQAYLFQGGEGDPTGYKLKENMMEIDGEAHSIEGLDGFREGLWMFKRKGIYYIIYPDDFPKRNKMRYAMSDNPLGPFKNNEVFVGSTDVITMHGSVVEYKDQWYVFYHNGNLSGGIPTNRSMCFDPIYFNEDGTIKMVEQTLGVELPTFHAEINFNEMFGSIDTGEYTTSDLNKHGIQLNAISSIQIPEGYVVECFEKDKFKGKSWIFKEDRIDLNEMACSDKISSIKISKVKADNLVKNPSFELTTQKLVKYWRSKSVQCISQLDNTAKGYYSLQYKGKGSPREIVQQVNIMPNTDYKCSVMLKVKADTKGKVIFDASGAFDESCKFEMDANVKANEWLEFEGTFNSGEANVIKLRCTTSSDFDGHCYWDNVSLIKL
ncbi:family 43 glycosylhydrolase [Saccharicrinis sp. 156]|uniref:family 43 glycosylhydrolase n=1 Tax=Saccharicrinis sp. 156 TaxID=3417574 RepID=UPI003D324939